MLCSKGRVGSNPTSGTKKSASPMTRAFPFEALLATVTLNNLVYSIANAVNSE